MVKNANDQSQRALQMMIDHQLNTSHKKITEIVKATNSNKVLKLLLNNLLTFLFKPV